MACVTLKRSLDLDPLEALHSPNRPQKRRRCTPLKSIDRDSTSSSSLSISQPSFTSPPSSEPSVFRESQLSPSKIANYLSDELKRLRKRRQIAEPYPSSRPSPPASPGSPEPMMADSTASHASTSGIARRHATVTSAAAASVASTASTQPGPSSPQKSLNSSNNLVMSKSSKGERPVFTLKQMTMICEKLCKERTDQVRQEYDQILQQKLSEQYDAFVKFVDHQIQQRFNQSQLPSYLS